MECVMPINLMGFSPIFCRSESEAGKRPGIRIIVLLFFFLSGASWLIYEVVWNRMMTLVFGSTVYAVTTVLTAYMAGMALGSLLFGRFIDRRGHPLKVYAYLFDYYQFKLSALKNIVGISASQ